MKLYFVRHTSAAESATSDAKRPLSRQGEEEARRVGAALAGIRVKPSRIFSSPLLRARQTAGLIAGQLNFAGPTDARDELLNGRSTSELLAALKGAGDAVVLIGHMPSLAEHVAAIVGENSPAEFTFGKGTVACIELDWPTLSAGKLQWLRHLPQLASSY